MSQRERIATGIAATGACLTAVIVHPVAAAATPPSGVSATLISKVRIGSVELVRREITIAPGGYTGWHYHDGPVVGRVKSGTLTHVEAGRAVRTYRTGDVIVEPSGVAHVHIGRNNGTTPVVLDALYILPVGSPFSEDAPDPSCNR